jgi:hypothetical protein
MPKIDIDKVPLDSAPAIRGRSTRRWKAARASDLPAPPASRSSALTSVRSRPVWPPRSATGTKTRTSSFISGEVVLREDGGESVLKSVDAAAWKAGAANGHCLINRSDRDAVFFEVGTRAPTERAHYSDIDMKVEHKGIRYTKKNGEPY